MTRLAGQVALVTQAATGIGAGIARRFAAEGACVVVHHANDAESADRAARVVAGIVWRGGRAIAAAGDVTHWPDVRRLFADIAATFGRLDILVNSSGADRTPSGGEADLFGAMLMCQEAVRLFGADGGSIINLTAPGLPGLAPDLDPAAAPGMAIDALTRGLTRAFGPRNVRVHAIDSGLPGPRQSAAIDVLEPIACGRGMLAVQRQTPAAVARLAADLAADSARARSRPAPPMMAAG